MGQGSSRKLVRHSSVKEISSFVWKMKVLYEAAIFVLQSQTNPINTLHTSSLKWIFKEEV
jgi:hypothetical protein